MDFDYTSTQQEIRTAVRRICQQFGPDYWRRCDEASDYPAEFVAAMTEAGWLAALIPEAYGGSGLALLDACVTIEGPTPGPRIGFARDLSRSGIAFVTTIPLPPETVRLTLPQEDGRPALRSSRQTCDNNGRHKDIVGAGFFLDRAGHMASR